MDLPLALDPLAADGETQIAVIALVGECVAPQLHSARMAMNAARSVTAPRTSASSRHRGLAWSAHQHLPSRPQSAWRTTRPAYHGTPRAQEDRSERRSERHRAHPAHGERPAALRPVLGEALPLPPDEDAGQERRHRVLHRKPHRHHGARGARREARQRVRPGSLGPASLLLSRAQPRGRRRHPSLPGGRARRQRSSTRPRTARSSRPATTRCCSRIRTGSAPR